MPTLLNIILGVLAMLSAVASIGGETWDKKKAGLASVTTRGWVSVVLILLTFGTAVAKELLDYSDTIEAKARAREAELKICSLNQQLALALEAVNRGIPKDGGTVRVNEPQLPGAWHFFPSVYPGDIIHYTARISNFNPKLNPNWEWDTRWDSVGLKIGDTLMSVDNGGTFVVPGKADEAMTMSVTNPKKKEFELTIKILSSRTQSNIKPIEC